MIEADSVLSTPRTDSSLRQPMFPPRADSRPCVFQPNPLSDSPRAKPSPASLPSPPVHQRMIDDKIDALIRERTKVGNFRHSGKITGA